MRSTYNVRWPTATSASQVRWRVNGPVFVAIASFARRVSLGWLVANGSRRSGGRWQQSAGGREGRRGTPRDEAVTIDQPARAHGRGGFVLALGSSRRPAAGFGKDKSPCRCGAARLPARAPVWVWPSRIPRRGRGSLDGARGCHWHSEAQASGAARLACCWQSFRWVGSDSDS